MAGVTSFGDASGDSVVSLGSKAWNIADGYTKVKILKILIEIDLYETIAKFGYKDSSDRANTNPEDIPEIRVEALNRVFFCIEQVMGNCKFAIHDKKDREDLIVLFQRIRNVEEMLDGIANSYYDDITKNYEMRVNEGHFRVCARILRSVKDDLNFILNNNDLIFRGSDDVDLDKIMNDIIEGG